MSSIVPYDNSLAILEAANLGLVIQEPNRKIVYPNEDNAMWLAFDVIGHTLDRLELGGRSTWEESGSVNVFVVVKSFEGSRAARIMAKTIANLYRMAATQPVIYRNASIGLNTMEIPNGSWWALGVSIDYSYQDIDTD